MRNKSINFYETGLRYKFIPKDKTRMTKMTCKRNKNMKSKHHLAIKKKISYNIYNYIRLIELNM